MSKTKDEKALEMIFYQPFQQVTFQSQSSVYKVEMVGRSPKENVNNFFAPEDEVPPAGCYIQLKEKKLTADTLLSGIRFVSWLNSQRPPTPRDVVC